MGSFWQRLRGDRRGSVLVLFAIGFGVVVALVLGVASISSAMSQRSQAQDAIDAAALASVKLLAAGDLTDEQIISKTRAFLAATEVGDTSLAQAQITLNRNSSEVSIDYSGNARGFAQSAFLTTFIPVEAKTKARLGGSTIYPVCILITEPVDNHTLRASNGSKLDLNNCLVQVNTQNWDAVEAKDNAYIHINGGENCYVGDIHFGDVQPEKMPTCQLFRDPFASLDVSTPNKCDFTDFLIDQKHPHSAPLGPGVYCGGITIAQDATFLPGVYYVKDGPLEISGSQTDIVAEGVTFLLVGHDAGLSIKSGGKMTFSPAQAGTAGKFDGFLFYLDQSINTDPNSISEITGADVTMSGTAYFNGQHLVIGMYADVVFNPGSIIAGYLLPQGGNLNFTGQLASASAAASGLQKAVASTTPVLVK